MKNILKYFIIIAIFCVNLLGLSKMIFSAKEFFAIQFFAFIIFFISAAIILYYLYKNRMAAWVMLLLFFAAYLINITFLYFYSENQILFVFLIFASVIGFLLSIDNLQGRKIKPYETEIIHEAEQINKAEQAIEKTSQERIQEYKKEILREADEIKKAERKIKEIIIKSSSDKTEKKKTQQFVASRKGKKYHVSSCRWAEKILPKRKINFQSKKQAEEEGFKPCDCVK